jgi:hypothetical protein
LIDPLLGGLPQNFFESGKRKVFLSFSHLDKNQVLFTPKAFDNLARRNTPGTSDHKFISTLKGLDNCFTLSG